MISRFKDCTTDLADGNESVGGKLTISACRDCNSRRGASGSYKPFLHYIHQHPEMWENALLAAGGFANNKLLMWLREEDLEGTSLRILLGNLYHRSLALPLRF